MKVPTRTHRCQQCHSPFQGKEQVVSFLIFGEDEILRCDVCSACSDKAEKEVRKRSESRPMATWKTLCEMTAAPPKVPEPLLKVLREDVSYRPGLRWLLALYLERHHILVLQREVQGGDTERWYELPEIGEVYHVRGIRPERQDLLELQQLMAAVPPESRKAS